MYWQPVGSLVSPEHKAKRMLIDKISMAAFSASSSVAAVLEVKEKSTVIYFRMVHV